MAILNIADKLTDEIKSKLTSEKLLFTKDKHIITHGVDFLEDYSEGLRGLVPTFDKGTGFGVLGKNGWELLTTDLSISDNISDNKIPSTLAIKNYVANAIVANDLTIFKGVIYGNSDNTLAHKLVGGADEINGFPQSANIGDLYRIFIRDGYQGQIIGSTPQTGDCILCVKSYSNIDGNSNEYWLFLDTNVKGTRNFNINGTIIPVLSDATGNNVNIYAPTTEGEAGQILVSTGNKDDNKGNTPIWAGVSISANKNVLTLKIGSNDYTVPEILPTASDEDLGILKVFKKHSGSISAKTSPSGLTESPYYYGLEIDGNGKAFVHVPVQEYQEVSTTGAGIAPIIPTTADNVLQIQSPDIEWVLTTTSDGKSAWKRLPQQIETTDTWRPVYVRGNLIDGGLNLTTVENSSIAIGASVDANGVTSVAFDLLWYNLDTDKYE